ncbi:hypothetical protein PtB15_5B572 [Puccinia triticina]|nr:hypothetical protein PtB15_5B572 [Puccinia triticina]
MGSVKILVKGYTTQAFSETLDAQQFANGALLEEASCQADYRRLAAFKSPACSSNQPSVPPPSCATLLPQQPVFGFRHKFKVFSITIQAYFANTYSPLATQPSCLERLPQLLHYSHAPHHHRLAPSGLSGQRARPQAILQRERSLSLLLFLHKSAENLLHYPFNPSQHTVSVGSCPPRSKAIQSERGASYVLPYI